MATFSLALSIILREEGRYVNDPKDPGGETYRGVARNMQTKWDGWTIVDQLRKQSGFPANLDRNQDLQNKVEAVYRNSFWDEIKGDDLSDQHVATSIFDFAVNAGVPTSAALAQYVVEVDADGIIGPQTVEAINKKDPEYFLAAFTVAKIVRYVRIVNDRPLSRDYFFGWVSRTINS